MRRFWDPWYAGRRWRRLRASILAEQPLCSDPFGDHGRDGVTVAAEEVHHVAPRRARPDLAYTRANLEALCRTCHRRLTGMGR